MSVTLNLADPATFLLLLAAAGIVLAGFGLFVIQLVAWGNQYDRMRQRMKQIQKEQEELERKGRYGIKH